MMEKIIENIQIYEDVISDLCKLYENMGISENIVKVFEYFRYMYMNGYLSSKDFQDGITDSFINLENYIPMDVCGLLVMAGVGVCRHTTDFLDHIYNNLKYISSRLFVYYPDTRVTIENREQDFLTNYHAQKLIDEVLKEIDLFGQEKQVVSRDFDGVLVKIEYLPSKTVPNHVVNIVEDSKAKRSYILDTRYHAVGEIVDEKKIILNNLGLKSSAYPEQHPNSLYHTYYNTDYEQGIWILNGYDTIVDQDVMCSILYRDSAAKFESEYKNFKKRNQDRFNTVANNLELAKKYLPK